MRRLGNAVFFQVVWIATVAGAAYGFWWVGPLAVTIFAAWQVPLSDDPRADLVLIAIAALIGFVIDSAFVAAGLLSFPTAVPWPALAPIWIVAMWASFALTLNHSLAGLKAHPGLASLLGLVGGPLAYWLAARAWQAVELRGEAALVLLTIGLVWAVVTPLLLQLAERLRQHPVEAAA